MTGAENTIRPPTANRPPAVQGKPEAGAAAALALPRPMELKYNAGFGNEFATEALPGALPAHNNPRRCPYGLYAEQLSGTAFTAARHKNRRTWLYRKRPSAMQGPLVPFPDRAPLLQDPDHITPERLRWRPVPVPAGAGCDFVQGLITVAGHGDPAERSGLAIHLYCANASMQDTCFSSSDGELLIVPQRGTLLIRTELGQMLAGPHEIAVIPRGVKFAVFITDKNGRLDAGGARGYMLEVYAGSFELPELGLIGANGLAAARDFRYPTAAYEERDVPFLSIVKFQGALFKSTAYSSPFDVVAWHGNYAPYVYDLRRFCPVNSVRFDHMDPSIFTVLTVPSTVPGVAVADFVLFPPRWATQEDTMRLPYFHRNCMTEYMGVIAGRYEAKGGGFLPGAGSLHSVMAPHGPDATTFNKFCEQGADAGPERMNDDDLAFMFETSRMLKVSNWAMSTEFRDREYRACWDALRVGFDSRRR